MNSSTARRPKRTPFRWPTDWVPTILIVDDDYTARRILEARLQAAQCRVLQAENGVKGLALARQARPDLIVLDWMMPEIDGPEFCAVLKADEDLKATHVLMLTAKGESSSLVEAIESGADDFLAKPYEPEVLMARIGAGLQARELHRRVEGINAQLCQANARLVEHQMVLEDDIAQAAGFVRSMLPISGTVASGLKLAWRFTPSMQLGGDLFNACPISDDLAGLYIMDMSGRGIGAALRAVSTSTILQAGWRSSTGAEGPIGLGWRATDPSLILTHLDRLMPAGDDGEHFTIWLGIWNHRTQTLTYASAGHPAPILVRAQGAVERLGGVSLPIGFWWTRQAGCNATVTLADGDRLILFSDGLFEAFNGDGAQWGMERLEESCRRTWRLPLEDALDSIVGEVQAWQGGEGFRDDMALMVLQVGAFGVTV